MKKLPLFNEPVEEYSKERIDEARNFIKDFILNKIPVTDRFMVSSSAGKDSTILLQLVMEALDELGDFGKEAKKRMLVTTIILQAETNAQREWKYLNKKIMEDAGLDVWTGYTIPEEMFGTEVLGVGRVSMMLRAHVCNQMKETPIAQASKLTPWNFTGSRAEESPRRAKEDRVGKYTSKVNSTIIRAIQPLKAVDVWGYLKEVGTTKWGLTYNQLREFYDRSGQARDGCWCCCFRLNTDGLSPAQKITLSAMNSIRKVTSFTDIDPSVLPSVGRPIIDVPNFQEQWKISQHPATAGSLRPVEMCKRGLRWVRVLEKKYGEKILCDEENDIIPVLQEMREKYNMRQIRRWMFNDQYWCGRELVKMPDWVRETYRKYTPPKMVLNRSNGDWFGRHAIEWERRKLYEPFWQWDWTKKPDTREEAWNNLFDMVKESGYFEDMWKEPLPGLFGNGDPASVGKENLELEIKARN